MESKLTQLPIVGLMEVYDFEKEDLENIYITGNELNPGLTCVAVVENDLFGPISFQVQIIEIIPPESRDNEVFFRKTFDNLIAREKDERPLFGSEIELEHKLEGPRWILIGAIISEEGFLIPPPIIIAYYENSESLYSMKIKEEIGEKIFMHTMFRNQN